MLLDDFMNVKCIGENSADLRKTRKLKLRKGAKEGWT